jgi:hypothetical protein
MTYKIKDEDRDIPFIAGSLHCNTLIKEIVGKAPNINCKICNKIVSKRNILEHFRDHFDSIILLTERDVKGWLVNG